MNDQTDFALFKASKKPKNKPPGKTVKRAQGLWDRIYDMLLMKIPNGKNIECPYCHTEGSFTRDRDDPLGVWDCTQECNHKGKYGQRGGHGIDLIMLIYGLDYKGAADVVDNCLDEIGNT